VNLPASPLMLICHFRVLGTLPPSKFGITEFGSIRYESCGGHNWLGFAFRDSKMDEILNRLLTPLGIFLRRIRCAHNVTAVEPTGRR
jgi:hypothetical protein